MKWALLAALVAAAAGCAPPPSPDAGCGFYGSYRASLPDQDFLAAPDGLRRWIVALDEGMTATCR